ncbi:MAG: ATPase [Draconibacterium sp.]|nr:ATPase [Draconibacterium sp.]
MILIADSGSTKTSWCLTNGDDFTEYHSTGGLNPFLRSSDEIADELRLKLLPKTGINIHKIFFYGAGVINPEKGGIVKNALLELYPKASIEVESDLLAAARSTLVREKGIACILGTGSNSCFYNGIEIVEHIPPLGFILGDEGSGAVLGRKIVGDFLKGVMPEHISEEFKNRFQITYAGFMEGVYNQEFINRNILLYSDFREQPLSFVGSVAFYFQDQLKNVLNKNQLQLKTVLKEPLNGLLKFHTEK